MKLKNILAFLAGVAVLLTLAPSVSADEYYPLIEEGKVWEYESGYTRKINGQSESGMLNQFYKFDGSATVNGNVYRRFVCFKTEYWKRSGNDYDGNLTFTLTETDNQEGVSYYLREEGEKVYVLTSEDQIFSSYFFPDDRFDTEITSDRYGEYLRYDFSLKNGETFLLCADSYVGELYQTTVAVETPEVVGDDECRAFSLRGEGIFYDAPIVEGLGATAHGNLALFSTTFISGKPGLDSGRQGPKAKPWRGSRLVRVYDPAGNVIYGTPRETTTTYHPLFEEGKVWNVLDKYYDYTNDETTIYHKQISYSGEWNDGNHLLSQVNCFNQEEDTTTPYSLLEENRIIYIAADQTYRPSIDFNLRKGDAIPVRDGSGAPDGEVIAYEYVVNDEVIDIKGTPRRVLSIGSQEDGDPFTYWIEGIGSIDDWDMLVYPVPTCAPFLQSRRIMSCYLNGECIFSYDDFKSYMSQNGIESVDMDDNQRGHLSYSDNSLHVNGYSGEVAVNVYSLDGTLCLSGSISGTEALSASCLPAGCYLARAIFKDGHPVSLKFIKK